MNSLLKAAQEYKQLGISVAAIEKNKKSFHYWRKYQHSFMTDELLIKVFSHTDIIGIAAICGTISGNLELIDIDSKNDLSNCLFQQYTQRLQDACSELVARLVIASTKNDGYHFFYRCKEIGRSTVLAKRPCTDAEKINNPRGKIKVLIESKGSGGYGLVYPTTGYKFIQNSFENIPVIEPEQRRLLFNIARSFNLYRQPEPDKQYPASLYYDPDSPFDDYNSRGDVIDLLKRHGWKVIRSTSVKTYFRRPGITDHDTSGDYNHQLGLFGVFSTSTEFEAGKGYRPYAVYAILECDGNFKLAAKRLLAEGYGIPYKFR